MTEKGLVMDEPEEVLEQAERLLGRFDFAARLASEEDRHREEMRATLLSFVDVMDSFDRFFANIGSVHESSADPPFWLATVQLIAKQLDQALRKAGAIPVKCVGLEAEPGRHEIVEAKDVSGMEADTIMEEVVRGYDWGEEILRKPRVIVARGADNVERER